MAASQNKWCAFAAFHPALILLSLCVLSNFWLLFVSDYVDITTRLTDRFQAIESQTMVLNDISQRHNMTSKSGAIIDLPRNYFPVRKNVLHKVDKQTTTEKWESPPPYRGVLLHLPTRNENQTNNGEWKSGGLTDVPRKNLSKRQNNVLLTFGKHTNEKWETPPPYRGVLLDLPRNYFNLSSIEQIIDFISFLNLTILHFRLSDDQGFMVGGLTSIQGTPTTENGPLYSVAELQKINDYAISHGVLIVPEIGVPGHAGAWVGSTGSNMKAVVSCPREACRTAWSIPLDVSRPDVTAVLAARVITEIHEIFQTPFVHLGGDEIHSGRKCFLEAGINPNRDSFEMRLRNELLRKNEVPLSTASQSTIEKTNFNVIRWEESRAYNPDLIHIWQGDSSYYPHFCQQPDEITGKRTPCIVSAGLYWDKGDIDVWEVYQNTVSILKSRPFGIIGAPWELDVHAWMERNIWGNLLGFSMAMTEPKLKENEFRKAYLLMCSKLLDQATNSNNLMKPLCYIPMDYKRFKTRFHWREGQRDALVCKRMSNSSLPCRTHNCPASGKPSPNVTPVSVYGNTGSAFVSH